MPLLVLDGLPAGVNLLESFLYGTLGTRNLFTERLRTRFMQGVGRCSRSATDYACVLVIDERSFSFCAQRENRAPMQPELQAEIEFGIRASREREPEADDFLHLLELMLDQTEDWRAADAQMRATRDERNRESDPEAQSLMAVACSEVDYLYALWVRNFSHATERAQAVADGLSGEAAREYRAWWQYQAGLAAWLAGAELGDGALAARASSFFDSAAASSRRVQWFADVASLAGGAAPATRVDEVEQEAFRRVRQELDRLRYGGPRFAERTEELRDLIAADEANRFEAGLETLGRLLGFTSTRPSGNAAPDGVWALSRQCAVVFEAKTEESPSGAVSVATVRQAADHVAWVRRNGEIDEGAEIVCVLVTPRETIEPAAHERAEDLFAVTSDELRGLAAEVIAALARARSRGSEEDHAATLEAIDESFGYSSLGAHDVLARLRVRPLPSLPVAG